MLVVGYVYSLNGMASWCWEAANALHESGLEVVLICKQGIQAPNYNKAEVVYIEEEAFEIPKNIISRIYSQTFGRMSAKDAKLAMIIDTVLRNKGKSPQVYVWNDTSLFNTKLSVPQFVVAWAFPSSLQSYLNKIPMFCKPGLSKDFLITTLNSIGFYRRDQRAYRNSAGVLAVSDRLKKDLIASGIKAFNVYPCIEIGDIQPAIPIRDNAVVHLVMSALNLEDPRKNLKWVLDCFIKYPIKHVMLHLIGNATDAFKKYYSEALPAKFYGFLTRAEAMDVLKNKDVFIFASILDDWGYVQTEAMAKGLIVVAPDLSPFDEIVGDSKLLYRSGDEKDFSNKLSQLLQEDLFQIKQRNYKRALSLFSRPIFAASIIKITKGDTKHNHSNLQ